MWGQDATSITDNVSTFGILAGVLTSLIVVLYYVVRTFQSSNEVNKAVNNIGPGETRLYDQVVALLELAAEMKVNQAEIVKDMTVLVDAQNDFSEKGWRRLPPYIGDASALTETIRRLQYHDERIDEKLDEILAELKSHVEWEEGESHKYDKVNAYIDLFMRDDEH